MVAITGEGPASENEKVLSRGMYCEESKMEQCYEEAELYIYKKESALCCSLQAVGKAGARALGWEEECLVARASGPLEPLPVRSQSLGLLVLTVRSHGQISSRVLT